MQQVTVNDEQTDEDQAQVTRERRRNKECQTSFQ